MSTHTEHEILIDAPPATVYGLIADAVQWPQFFAPSVHVERTELPASAERLRIWATANGDVKSWTSRRVLHADRIEFRQEVSSPPVAAMAGEWIVQPAGDGTKLTLTHDFEAVDNDLAGVAWITEATNRNSETELGNIKALAEQFGRLADLVFTFADSVLLPAGSTEAAYDFLYQAKLWPERLPHVTRMDLTEDVENVQPMTMDTLAKDGSVHTTESVRVCFPHQRIVYKQTVPPSLMTAHTGEWTLAETGDGVLATSNHTVTVNEANIAKVLGAKATVADAREFIRKAAGGNSLATLTHLKNFLTA